jgi:hypothetical protein
MSNRALRRRELLELAKQTIGPDGSAAQLALALDALELARWRVTTVIDDTGQAHAGEPSPAATRHVAYLSSTAGVRALLERAPDAGGWALISVEGALVLVLTGRRRQVRVYVRERIRRERRAGRSLRQIAAGLEQDGIRTPRGGARWRPQQVKRLLRD